MGLGTDKDPTSAFVNYLEAARKNNAASQYAVGRAYLTGLGTDPNFPQSFTWLKSADVAPSFYPVLSSFPAWVVPCWAGEATVTGAEPLA
ncbi:hypothetical protein [Mesorhizobium sp. CA14]|uniref:hypothetical protein n=1 Tax=Mesorhizobium sp. CA14 TaxID=2876642 RepID=UPI0021E290F5|nr:hypothetical protein [Mesorhizobium sp. CA14]